MDPISAFGLAVNILTVIDLSMKVISTASEIRSYGESITTSDRVAVAQHFESQCEKLIESSKTTVKPSDEFSDAAILTEDDLALRELAEEAKAIARDIQQGLVMRQKDRPLLKTLRDAVLSVWGEREMKEKTERLREMRAEIQFGLMVSIKSSVDDAALRGEQSLKRLDDARKQVIQTLLSDNHTMRSEMKRRVEELNQSVLNHLDRDANLAGQRHDELLDAISGSSRLGTSEVPQDPALTTERILNSLWFPRINDRYEDVLSAHRKTFKWIFSRDLRLQSSSNFVDWIEDGTGVYWMSGRAGSGKSTLIKYVADAPQTKMLLRTWAHGQPLLTAKYLFWDQSSDFLQKSLDGLFRGILHEIISGEKSFAPLLFPDQFNQKHGWSGPFPTSNELNRAFKRLVSLESSPTRVVLLIDGLDEYSASHEAQRELAENLKKAACSRHLKIIASSRPETVFEKAFADCEKLYLHDMTSGDRKLFVTDKLYGHRRTSYLVELSGGKQAIECLIQSAAERSEGIFLWLRLVVEALIRELDVCESIRDLQSILIQFPRGLEKLFLHMMRRMLKENGRRGFECLWIMHRSLGLQYKQSPQKPTTKHQNSWEGDPYYSFRLTAFSMDGAQMPFDAVIKAKLGPLSSAALEDTVTKVENRLRSWCAGLLELSPASTLPGESGEPEVKFIHRSVSEFLELPSTNSDLAEEMVETSFDVNFMLMKGLLVKLKREATSWDFHNTSKIWVLVELIMRVAQFANNDRRHETNALLSELDRSMTSLVEILQKRPCWEICQCHSGDNHWTRYFPWVLRNDFKRSRTPCDCIRRNPRFLSIAVENGLKEFVLDNLDNPKIKSSMNAAIEATLLNSACRPPPFSMAIPGTIRPAIIHRLLDLGADPNLVCQDGVGKKTTPWQSMLKTVNDLEIMSIEGARQFAEILTAMIMHGADQRVRIRTKKLNKTTHSDNFTAPQTTDRLKSRFESRRHFALSQVQIEAPIESEDSLYASSSYDSLVSVPSGDSHIISKYWRANSLTVRDIINQLFITTPSFRRESYDSELPGKFVPFEDIDYTWGIRITDWGDRYGTAYPDNSHPPRLTPLERESMKEMGFALLKLLDQKKPTHVADAEAVQGVSVESAGSEAVHTVSVKTADSEPVQNVSVKQPRISKLVRLHEMKEGLLVRIRRNRK